MRCFTTFLFYLYKPWKYLNSRIYFSLKARENKIFPFWIIQFERCCNLDIRKDWRTRVFLLFRIDPRIDPVVLIGDRHLSGRRSAVSGLAGGPTGSGHGPRARRRRPGNKHRIFLVQHPGIFVDHHHRQTGHVVLRQRPHRLDTKRVLARSIKPVDRPPALLALLGPNFPPCERAAIQSRVLLEPLRLFSVDRFRPAGRVRLEKDLQRSSRFRFRSTLGRDLPTRRRAVPPVHPLDAQTGGDEMPSSRMVVVEVLEEVQQPALSLETSTSRQRRRILAIDPARRVDLVDPRAVPQVRGEVSVSRLVVVVAPVAEVRVDGWTGRGTRPEKTFYDRSRDASSRTPARQGSQRNFRDGRREFGQSDVQEGPTIERRSSLSWIRRIVRVFFYFRYLRERSCLAEYQYSRSTQDRSKRDSIEDRPMINGTSRRAQRKKTRRIRGCSLRMLHG